tara:strand:+ start:5607 stop:6737 length:1131 start_codon:yes stop_codon:yes gene_type:complete
VTEFENIRPYNDDEVNEALQEFFVHPMFKALLQFTFPEKSFEEIKHILASCHSIFDFQTKVIYNSIQKVLEKSTDGLSTSGFDELDPTRSYLYLSNHRDIILDTSFINVALYEHEQKMTASAIGDNLVKKPFLMALSRLNRNFLVQRSLSPREMLRSSQVLSKYILHLLQEKKQSIWLAQREGRTKDGNDRTQQGVLKMLALAKAKNTDVITYLRTLNIVPVAISYEFDPTDVLKVPELVAKNLDIEYIKSNNEDFNSILQGALGQKKRVHIAVGSLDEKIYDEINAMEVSENDKLQALATAIDREIYKLYKLWPSNYVAMDLLNSSEKYAHAYSVKDKRHFERRLDRRVDNNDKVAKESFLSMYANPVRNREENV